jgi:hypothetical protein
MRLSTRKDGGDTGRTPAFKQLMGYAIQPGPSASTIARDFKNDPVLRSMAGPSSRRNVSRRRSRPAGRNDQRDVEQWTSDMRTETRKAQSQVPNPSRPKGSNAIHPDLPALLKKLRDKMQLVWLQTRGFDRLADTMADLVQHPPPHVDPDAFWQHIADRVNEACDTLDKMRALLPPDMRVR